MESDIGRVLFRQKQIDKFKEDEDYQTYHSEIKPTLDNKSNLVLLANWDMDR